MKDMYLNGIMGVVVGDALGCPVQFESRSAVASNPVTGMRGYGTFNLPEGSWTDDSSLTLALLDALNKYDEVDLSIIMRNFEKWLYTGEYTPYGYSYDVGGATSTAINRYSRTKDPYTCGCTGEHSNGNGSLMRILPICLYCVEKGMDDEKAIKVVHEVGALTHAHLRSKIGCGLYYFMVKYILCGEGSLNERLQDACNRGFDFYDKHFDNDEVFLYNRLRDLGQFHQTKVWNIRSSGYVIDSLEASVWSLLNTASFEEALLCAVNLGDDSDTVGAIAGGLGGLYYGIGREKGIPEDWISKLKRVDYITEMCNKADERSEK